MVDLTQEEVTVLHKEVYDVCDRAQGLASGCESIT